jgi:hypothetical protein
MPAPSFRGAIAGSSALRLKSVKPSRACLCCDERIRRFADRHEMSSGWRDASPGTDGVSGRDASDRQRLYILPALDLVAVVTAGVYDRSPATLTGATVLNQFVLPAALAH